MGSESKFLMTGFVLVIFASQFMWVNFSPVATFVASDLGVSVVHIGFLSIVYPFFFLILTVPSGVLLDKNFGRWFFFGALMTALGALGRFFLFDYWWFFVCQLFAAIGQPFLLNSFVPFSSHFFEEDERSLVIAFLTLTMYLGAVSALLSGYFLYAIGSIFFLVLPPAVSSILGLVLVSFGFLRSVFPKYIDFRSSCFSDLKLVVRKKDLWIVSGVLGFGVASYDNLATWLQPALSTVGLGYVAGRIIGLAIIFGLVGMLYLPKFVSGRNIRSLYLRTVTFLVALLFLISSIFLSEFALYICLILGGFILLPAYAVIMNWVEVHYEKYIHGTASGFIGLVSRAISVAFTSGSIFFIESANLYFMYLSLLVFLAFVLSTFLPKD